MAAFLGLSGLAQAGLPTVGSAFERLVKVNFIQNTMDTVLQNTSQVSFDPEKIDPTQANVVRFSIPFMPTPTDEVKIDHPAAPQNADDFSKIFDRLSGRIDGLKSQFDTMMQSLQKNEENTWPSENKAAIVELRREMQRLSDKIDHFSNGSNPMASPMAAGGANLDMKNEIKPLEKQAAPPKKEALPSE
jgi:hypothetical protein